MRWKCHGNVSAEMCFNLGERSRRGGPNESMFLYATPPHSQSVDCRDGKIAELGLVRLVYDCLTPLEEFASGKWFGEEAREVLVTFDVRYDNLVIFHYLAGDEMTPLHVLELRVVLWIIGSVDRSFTIEVKSRRFGFASCEFVVERAEVYGLLSCLCDAGTQP